jgi:hypothetical protein
MSDAMPRPQVPAEAVRTGVVASQEPTCAVCGGPRAARKRETCSAKCRAALHRQRQGASMRTQLAGLRAGLVLIRAQVDDRLAEVDALLGALVATRRRE